MIFTIEKIDELLQSYNGKFSVFFPIVKEKFMKELMSNPAAAGLHDGEECFFEEFSFFENDYLRIKKDMFLSGIREPVIDIGCQFGLQSELFLDTGYIGIDASGKVFLNESIPGVLYKTGLFPDVDVDISSKVVISNMSLGFFNSWIDKSAESNDVIDKVDSQLIQELSKAKILYCCSRPIFIEELKKYFKHCERIKDDVFDRKRRKNDISTGVYKFYN